MSDNQCVICGCKEKRLYNGLRDYSFGAPGKWDLIQCANPECGLIRLDPAPSGSDLKTAYKDYYTHYDSNGHSRPPYLYNYLKRGYLAGKYNYAPDEVSNLCKFLGIALYLHAGIRTAIDGNVMYLMARPNAPLLDVGCGNGYTLNFLRALGWNAEGVDNDPLGIENAKKKGLEAQCGSINSQNYQDNFFSAITMRHFIEHSADPLSVLRKAHNLLKPGGQLVITTPNSNSLGHKIFKNYWRGLEPPRHLYVFNPKPLRRLISKAGFNDVKVFTTINGAYEIFRMSFMIKHANRAQATGLRLFAIKFLANVMELAEWLVLKMNPYVGEELVIIANKT